MKKNAETEMPKQGMAQKFHELRVFFDQAKMELKKVVWPDKQETISTSSAVLLLVVVMAFFLGIVDLVLTKIIAAILS
ncbi:preprotein translocase subunit SecE [Desulfomicrobium escambiense]|uniref:preprotein translocase subunit SecE n=1 Tax=Desulfomicrobium escambiense TaxID=29503 RepID=UPI00048D8DCB|nr:preprotein translocase subunit SecE [Desulfomicrobium escambiense]